MNVCSACGKVVESAVGSGVNIYCKECFNKKFANNEEYLKFLKKSGDSETEYFFQDGKMLSSKELEELLEGYKKKPLKRWLKAFKMVEGTKVLDVGCNTGITCHLLNDGKRKIVGIDVLEEEIRIAKKYYSSPNITFEVRDILKKPFPQNSFDCILFLETIEHVGNPSDFLQVFHSMLAPKGCLIISTPNAVSLHPFLRYLIPNMRGKLKQVQSQPRGTGTHTEHVGLWDVYTLARLLNLNGFECEEAGFVGSLGRFSDTVIVKARKK